MAAKKGDRAGSSWRGGTSKKKKAPAANGRTRGNIVLGPALTAKVRVPIDAKAYARKESEIAQLEVAVRKLRAKIKPDQVKIAEHRKAITELTADIEDETEERDVKVRYEYHFNTNEVRVLRAADMTEIDRRTMTPEEMRRTSDVEDQEVDGKDRPKAAAAPADDEAPATDSGDVVGDEVNAD